MLLTDVQLDENIRPLCEELNRLPGIDTNDSCGGHENPGRGQCPAGEWYVGFSAERSCFAWQSLSLIAFVAGELDEQGFHELQVWCQPMYEPGPLDFALHGYEGTDPVRFSARLIEARAQFG